MRKEKIEISYGQTFDEKVTIETLEDEARFKMCMKLYKLFPTVEGLETAIVEEALVLIETSI